MPLDPKFNKFSTASPVISSFSSEELASGIKFTKFYLTTSLKQSVGHVFLTSELTEGAEYIHGSQTLDTSPFNLVRTIPLNAHVYFFFTFASSAGGLNNLVNDVVLQKWDGTTATDITDTVTMNSTPGGGPTFLKMVVATETLIAVGQQLRFKYTVVTASGTNSVNGTVADPATVYVSFRSDQ